MTTAAELLTDRATDDPCHWQPIASLAAILGIAERTVRHRAIKGTIERLAGPNARTYYRQPPSQTATAVATSEPTGQVPAIIEQHLAAVAAAYAELAQVRENAATITATHIATLERLDDERARTTRLDDERRELTAQLEHERQRLAIFAELATAPWYARRHRRELRRALSA